MSLMQTEPWLITEPDVMELTGRLDEATAPAIEEDAMLCIQSGARRMVMDCENLSYVTAAGLRTLLVLARAMQKAGGHFAVCGLQPQAEEIFTAIGMQAFVPVYAAQGEAMIALGA